MAFKAVMSGSKIHKVSNAAGTLLVGNGPIDILFL
jgi:hypothetical protein